MVEENWIAMTADEKADLLREALKDVIGHQDTIIAELEARIMALEEQTPEIDGMPVILNSKKDRAKWLTDSTKEALALHRPAAANALRIVATGAKQDGVRVAAGSGLAATLPDNPISEEWAYPHA